MAIIIEEERGNRVSLITLLIWVVILGVVGVAVYYLFFKNPDFISFSTPSNFKSAEALSKITLDPDQLRHSPPFEALKQYIVPPPPAKLGRQNPFLGF